jgi:p-hydroxybenzoate 3-monooxygenase
VEALIHEGITIAVGGRRHRIDLAALTGGATVTIYGQTEVTKDLFEARDAMDGVIIDEVDAVMPHDIDTHAPYVTFRKDGREHRVDCDFVAGCDGYHGVCRTVIPACELQTFERVYPLGWLGLLSRRRRSPTNSSISVTSAASPSVRCARRLVAAITCNAGPTRTSWNGPTTASGKNSGAACRRTVTGDLVTGPSLEKSLAPLRSFVVEPLRHGRLFLAGDAAHIVPPTGAKGST